MIRKFHTDGGLSPPAICVIELFEGNIINEWYRCLPKYVTSPHEAEYLGILLTLSLCSEHDWATIKSDSRHAVFQLNGDWTTQVDDHLTYIEIIKNMIEDKKMKCSLTRVPRKKNLAGRRLESLKRYNKKHKTCRGWKFGRRKKIFKKR